MLMNRRLYRSRTDTILGGVAAGLASYLNTDPALVRIAWAILTPLTGGAALLAYIVGWIVVPEEPARTPSASAETDPVTGAPVQPVADTGPAWTPPEALRQQAGNAGVWVGVGLVALGVWFLAREYLPDINWGLIWPLVIVGIGALILVTSLRRR
jgi:phage shock protein PspC (stress-responsive transcriptional regulator)